MGRDRRGFEGVACEHQLSRQPLHVYTYLWTKPELLNDHCGRFRFVLTDTVLFKHQKPKRWLFTSHQDKGKVGCCSHRGGCLGKNSRLLV